MNVEETSNIPNLQCSPHSSISQYCQGNWAGSWLHPGAFLKKYRELWKREMSFWQFYLLDVKFPGLLSADDVWTVVAPPHQAEQTLLLKWKLWDSDNNAETLLQTSSLTEQKVSRLGYYKSQVWDKGREPAGGITLNLSCFRFLQCLDDICFKKSHNLIIISPEQFF